MPFIKDLSDKYHIVLGSSSPRRLDILTNNIGLAEIEVIIPTFEENLDKGNYINNPLQYVLDTSYYKALNLLDIIQNSNNFSTNKNKPVICICCDTIVTKNNIIYEKPSSPAENLKNLKEFCYSNGNKSNNIVSVISSVVIIEINNKNINNNEQTCIKNYKLHKFHEITNLEFDPETPIELIKDWVDTGNGLNASGGFQIQKFSGCFISKIDGDYFNVMGLPFNKTVKTLYDIYKNN
ncbi:related to Maf-like protein YOR111W [Saccharomycodes ludwigii]|uniref:Related to Maf-like protein YOR111W n=1 Tax=Saccharomycodes ludwigii TaxID=36035 RepID=A0A376B4S4_9ASCO|nr:hypothetical protein SCDLUD_002902 [Saccharomycodes ludwigii]KAH3901410.1 hypothetical protein SCDLUD_002902 [Saccharomycodes ludwigii]SSD59130.1 related to Maf-like protein YOR111W [Saccharomycodes ludwigii]